MDHYGHCKADYCNAKENGWLVIKKYQLKICLVSIESVNYIKNYVIFLFFGSILATFKLKN